MSLDRLRNAFYRDDATKGVLAIFADQPLEQKQREIYPELVPFVVEHLCVTEPKSVRSLTVCLRFLHRELAHEPTLAAQLYAAIGGRPVKHARDALFEFICAARDPAGIPLLRDGHHVESWVDAVIALRADELTDEILVALQQAPSRDLAVAAGHVGGERARASLVGPVSVDDVRPIGLAYLANSDDKAYFEGLGRTPNETTAKRIFALLCARGPKQRLTALTELVPGITKATESINAERLVAITLALEDKRADIVEGAALALAEYVKRAGTKARILVHPLFLATAGDAIERGVTEPARKALEAVRASIPAAPPFPSAKVVAKPPTRAEAAKARSQALLDGLREAAPFLTTTARNLALEAQIAGDPDDVTGYEVYADWLQQQGDPRGTWITLNLRPKGLAGKQAIDAFLAEHRVAILGPAAALVPKPGESGSITVDWQYGFIKRVTFGQFVGAHNLEPFLDATCGAVLQEIAFDEYAKSEVTALLLAKPCRTLVRIAFGTHDDPDPALFEAIPRLARDPDTRWRDVLARLDEQRKIKVELDREALPTLELRVPGKPAPTAEEVDAIVLGMKHELGLSRSLGMVAVVRDRFTPRSVDRFVSALATLWADANYADRLDWTFDALGPLGGDEAARFLGGRSDGFPAMRAIQATYALCKIGTPGAIVELARLAFDPARTATVRTSVWDHVRMHAADAEVQEPDAWIGLSSPPASERAHTVQRMWLESMMVDGRTFSLADFRELLEIPLRLEAARTLLWAERDPAGAIAGLFRVDERGQLVKRDGSSYAPTGRIGIVHPAELSDRELVAARQMFASVTQVIVQLHRPIFGLADHEATASELTRFAKRRVGFYPISTTLRARQWEVAANDIADDDGEDRWVGTRAFSRLFERDRVVVTATLNDTRGSIATVELQRREQLHDDVKLRELGSFGELHVATISELLWDLETAHGRRADEPYEPAVSEPEPPLAAPSDAPRGLVVERAKSGRAKCVVCQTAIPKDSMRIGLERFVETPTFRGFATVWLHPACREGVPELAGVTLDGLD